MRASHLTVAVALLFASAAHASPAYAGQDTTRALAVGMASGMAAVAQAVAPTAGAGTVVAAQAAATAAAMTLPVAKGGRPTIVVPSLLPPLPVPPPKLPVTLASSKRIAVFAVTIEDKESAGAAPVASTQHLELSALAGEPVLYYSVTKVPYRCETVQESCFAREGVQLRLTTTVDGDAKSKAKVTVSGRFVIGRINEIKPVTDEEGKVMDQVSASEEQLDIYARMAVGAEQSFSLPRYRVTLKLKGVN